MKRINWLKKLAIDIIFLSILFAIYYSMYSAKVSYWVVILVTIAGVYLFLSGALNWIHKISVEEK